MPFETPYIEPDDIDTGPDSTSAPEMPLYPPPNPFVEDPKPEDQRSKPSRATTTEGLDDAMDEDPQPSGPVTRSKKRKTVAVFNAWEFAKTL